MYPSVNNLEYQFSKFRYSKIIYIFSQRIVESAPKINYIANIAPKEKSANKEAYLWKPEIEGKNFQIS